MRNLCKDMIEKKQVEAKRLRLQYRQDEKDKEAKKKRELDEGLRRLADGEHKLKDDQTILKAN